MQTQKFQVSSKVNTVVWAVVFVATPMFCCFLFFAWSSMLGKPGDTESVGIQSITAVVIGLLAFVFFFAFIFIPVGHGVFSYLTLSDEGLECRLWPLFKIRCAWDNFEQIKKLSPPFHGDILTLKKSEVSGFGKGNVGLIKSTPAIPLFMFDGWPNGRLETELRKFAPNLIIQ